MSYCTLEEAWGSDFKKQKKKSRKEQRLEKEEQKMLHEAIDPQILIPETQRMADYRKILTPETNKHSNINAYDDSFDSYISPYQRYDSDPIQISNERILANNKAKDESYSVPETEKTNEIETQLDKLVHLTENEYHTLKQEFKEGFSNQTDEQFNQLILYIFTGIFYLLMLDMMYQLGKKSY
jgi:hypothetical protein